MDWLSPIVGFFNWLASLGYIGMFILAVISSATIILPTPFFIILFVSASVLNPLLLGIICGFGTTIGELLSYYLGRGGKKILPEKQEKQLEKAGKIFHKYGCFLALMVFAATPLPDDIVGIFAGLIHYPKEKFFLSVLIGKLILCLAVAYAGFFSASWVLNFFGLSL
jgi:membrane protein YqaA with SNARE-associated domain